MTRRGIVLLSGGLDSGVAGAVFRRDGGTVVAALFFDYGQRAREREATAAGRLAERWSAPLLRLELPWLAALARRSGSRLLAGTGELPHGTASAPGDEASARAVWVPARTATPARSITVATSWAWAPFISKATIAPFCFALPKMRIEFISPRRCIA